MIVVGGGANGASTAYHLAARGVRRVLLLERRHLGAGATGKSGSLVRMHYTNEAESRLAFESLKIFREFRNIVGGDCGFEPIGFLQMVAPGFEAALERNVARQQRLGIGTQVVSRDRVRDLLPGSRVDDIGAAAWEPESGYADPAGTIEGFRRRASELGARILQWTPVRKILRRESRVTGVETSAGRIDAGAVVVAAGAWAPRLCRELGLELPARVKGLDTVQVERPRALTEPHVIFIDNVLGTYFRPESSIRTVVGVPCQEWDLDPDAPMVLAPGAAAIGAQILTHRIPAMEGATLARGYRAVDCYSRDRHAILGRVDGIDGLYLATAFSGAGFKISPAVGVCMAELILDGRAKTVDIAAFGLKRFAEGKSPEGPYPYAPRRDHTDR